MADEDALAAADAAAEALAAADMAALAAALAEEEEAALAADLAAEFAFIAAVLAALAARWALAFAVRAFAELRARAREARERDKERRDFAILYILPRKKIKKIEIPKYKYLLFCPNSTCGRPPHIIPFFHFKHCPKDARPGQWNIAPKFV